MQCWQATSAGSTITFQLAQNHTSALSVGYSYAPKTGQIAYDTWQRTTDSHFERWRPVSTAMHIRCVNNDEENEGWFECIRTNRDVLAERWGVIQTRDDDDAIKIYPAGLTPDKDTLDNWYKSQNWSLQPTYATGKIRDLGQYIWQLNCQKEDNDFQEFKNLHVAQRARVESNWTTVEGNAIRTTEPKDSMDGTDIPDGNELEDFRDTIYADQFDIILLRLRGIDSTKILIHTVHNCEYMVSDNTELAQYMSVSYSAESQLKVFKKWRLKNHKMPFQSITTLN
jgi:hypothetical protein